MFFAQALEMLQEGKSMRRISWPAAEGYLKTLDDMKFVWKIVTTPNPNAGNFIFAVDDFIADDWEEYMPGKAPLEVAIEEISAEAA